MPQTCLLTPSSPLRIFNAGITNILKIGSKYLDWNYFAGLSLPFIGYLDNLGLMNMVKYKGHWFPEVIRAFYCSLEYRVRDHVITADIRGKKISITEEKFAYVLGIPMPTVEFLCFTELHNSLNDSFYRKAAVYKTITGQDDFL